MSVIVKGMQMPKNCAECPVALSGKYCRINKTHTTYIKLPIRPDHCPLVELPEKHGRLIDADAFAENIKTIIERQRYDDLAIDKLLTVGEVLNAVIDDLKGMALYGYENAPTVIGAEDEG